MTTDNRRASAEAQIGKLIEARAGAIRAKDVTGAIADVAPEVLVFDVIKPLRHSGSDAVRQRARQWFSSYRGPIGYEICDLSIAAGEDVAFSHSLNRVVGTPFLRVVHATVGIRAAGFGGRGRLRVAGTSEDRQAGSTGLLDG